MWPTNVGWGRELLIATSLRLPVVAFEPKARAAWVEREPCTVQHASVQALGGNRNKDKEQVTQNTASDFFKTKNALSRATSTDCQ